LGPDYPEGVKAIVFVLAAALGAAVFLPRSGHADAVAACGVPDKSPVWIDYGGHDAPITPKPGLVLAVSSGTVVPGQMRAAGAAAWWREAAQATILVRQVYFTAPGPKGLFKMGPERASRAMRQGMRGLIAHFGQIGIPAARVALELQFQSAAGQGGRQGLQPKA